MLQKYTLTVLLSGTDSDEQNSSSLEKVKELLNKYEAKIIQPKEAYKRRLAFVIKKVCNGVYINIDFEIEKENIKKLNKELLLLNDILRFQINKYVEVKKIVKKKIENKVSEKKESTPHRAKKIDMDDLSKKLDEILED